MNYTRLYYASDVLQNGKLLVAGAEIGSGGNTVELFDPVANSWSEIPVPGGLIYTGPSGDADNSGFRDPPSIMLPNGKVMIAPIFAGTPNTTVLYDPVANTLSAGPAYLGNQNEVCWVKLPDDSILTIDRDITATERYIPSLNKWVRDAPTPVNLWSPNSEIGSSTLLANGKVIVFGGDNFTAIYTPSPLGGTNNGSWVQGPNIPAGLNMKDAPGAIMNNGKMLLTFNAVGSDNPFYIYEYDPNTQAFTLVLTSSARISDVTSMLVLPDGTVIFNDTFTNYIYQPDASPLAVGKPTIYGYTYNPNGTLHLSGTLLNGISQGAMYGDDAQQDSNYPLARFTDGSGNVTYGRTYNWSSTAVYTGGNVLTTEVEVPPGVFDFPGAYSLQIVANGNASDAVSYYGPVWVDFNYFSAFNFYFGWYIYPDNTIASGVSTVASGGTIAIKPSNSSETLTISKPMTIITVNGPATIGH
jgi:hypothetical protein